MTTRRINTTGAARLASFASFFRSYMHVGGVLLACVPIPIASWRLLPIYSQQKGYLTVYSSLFCFLLVGSMFSLRHKLAKHMFVRGNAALLIAGLPFAFIALTILSILAYHATLQESVGQMRMIGSHGSTTQLLENADASDIPNAIALTASYLGIFVFAECAFILLALREYVQDAMGLDEVKLLSDELRAVDR